MGQPESMKFIEVMTDGVLNKGEGFCAGCGLIGIDEDGCCALCGSLASGQGIANLMHHIQVALELA